MDYIKTIGINSNQPRGRGFNHPYDIAISSNGRIYVLNRMYPQSTEGIRIQICDLADNWYGEFGNGPGNDKDSFRVPVAMAFDSYDKLYVTDESFHQIKIFNTDGDFLAAWGGPEVQQEFIQAPAGICVDSDDSILVVEQHRGCITKIDPDGNIIAKFGKPGSLDGQFNLPWGITVDTQNNIYVADWRNDRIQKFDTSGHFLMTIGESGHHDGQLYRPSSVAVDSDGNIYVADWGNERVQVFDDNGRLLNIMYGEATLSKWALEWLEVNKDEYNARKNSNLVITDLPSHLNSPYHVSSQTEHLFWGPVSVKFDTENRFYVTEHSRHRIQIFQRCETTVS